MAKPERVYVVSNREYSSGGNLCGFLDKAQAEAYCNQINRVQYEALKAQAAEAVASGKEPSWYYTGYGKGEFPPFEQWRGGDLFVEELQLWHHLPILNTCKHCGRSIGQVFDEHARPEPRLVWEELTTYGDSQCVANDYGDHEPETVQ